MKRTDMVPLVLAEDPGTNFVASVPGPDGQMERYYVDLDSVNETLRRRVINSATSRAATRGRLAKKAKVAAIAEPTGLRIGYAYWGFLGDHKMDVQGKSLSTPDGNATYSWSIIYEAMMRGHAVMQMMPDRDMPATDHFGYDNFSAFAGKQRRETYRHLRENGLIMQSERGFPEIDLLLLEWRFPIPGRNCDVSPESPDYQPDLDRQWALLEHYSRMKETTVLVWDLDNKITDEDERRLQELGVETILETSIAPRSRIITRKSVEPPTCIDILMEHPTTASTTLLSYIGSRYERDDVIDEWIRPIANRDRCRGHVHFYGNWDRDLKECSLRWPGVVFHGRITVADFHPIYRSSAAVPLLAKRSYMERGFITPRVWEALLFGSVPVGLHGHTGIDAYTPLVARDPDHLLEISRDIMAMTVPERDALRRSCVDRIKHMDVRHFVDVLERAV